MRRVILSEYECFAAKVTAKADHGANKTPMLESILAKIGLDALTAGLKSAKSELSKKEYAALISEAVRELLKLHPDISGAEAKLLAARALGFPDSGDMLTARRILGDSKRHGKRKSAKKKAKRKVKRKAKKKAKKRNKTMRRARRKQL